MSKINDLREHIQNAHDFMIENNDSEPYKKACASAEATITELGYSDSVLYMDKDKLALIVDRDPELNSQKLK